jgi:protein-serine/threonine kinase
LHSSHKMSTSTMLPQSTLVSHNGPANLKLQTDPQPSSSSHPSSPELRPLDLRSPIVEEEEDEEETSSEAAEPVTPTDSHHPHTLQMNGKGNSDNVHAFGPINSRPPLIVNTPATPPPSAGKDTKSPPQQTPKTPITPLQKRPTDSSKDQILNTRTSISNL